MEMILLLQNWLAFYVNSIAYKGLLREVNIFARVIRVFFVTGLFFDVLSMKNLHRR